MRDKESGVAYVLWTFRRSNGVILHQEKMPGKMVDEKVLTSRLMTLIYLTTMALLELLDVCACVCVPVRMLYYLGIIKQRYASETSGVSVYERFIKNQGS